MTSLRSASFLLCWALALSAPWPAVAQKGGPGPAAGPVAQGPPIQIVSALPQDVAGFRATGAVTDFEQRPNGAGLGASAQYQGQLGGAPANATVYVYSGGQSGLPEGPDSPAVQSQLQGMGREVAAVARQRGNALVGEAGGPVIQGRNGRPAMRCTQFILRMADGTPVDSYGCLGVVGGRFLKIRLSSGNPSAPVNQAALTAFGRGIVMALGG